jgi:hypothetical protein
MGAVGEMTDHTLSITRRKNGSGCGAGVSRGLASCHRRCGDCCDLGSAPLCIFGVECRLWSALVRCCCRGVARAPLAVDLCAAILPFRSYEFLRKRLRVDVTFFGVSQGWLVCVADGYLRGLLLRARSSDLTRLEGSHRAAELPFGRRSGGNALASLAPPPKSAAVA